MIHLRKPLIICDLTADVFPDITLKMETQYPEIIPKLEGDTTMKPTDFAKYLTEFLSVYLPTQKNVSKNTIYSYRDTFKLLINYCQEIKKIPVERITLNVLSSEWITDFLEWLETNRKCSISTRNQRLAAIHSFFRYVQAEEPAGIFHFQKITAIPIKKAKKTVVEYLTPEAIKLLLEQPDKHTPKGRRDLTLISVLYDSGARVQELIDIRVCDVILQDPAVITLTGKGNKIRTGSNHEKYSFSIAKLSSGKQTG